MSILHNAIPPKVIWIATIIFLLVCIGIATPSLRQNATTNKDGTSREAVYSRISDFGQYSDWAKQQLDNGISMCATQNALAKTDPAVAFVANCGASSSTKCSTSNMGINTDTTCTYSQ